MFNGSTKDSGSVKDDKVIMTRMRYAAYDPQQQSRFYNQSAYAQGYDQQAYAHQEYDQTQYDCSQQQPQQVAYQPLHLCAGGPTSTAYYVLGEAR